MTVALRHGDCLDVLASMPDASIDSIVTDPPYELGFMGKKWDASGIAYNVELWRECLRVLKPGGHLLAFGGTRTYHRMAVAIEDAGFEIRDSLHWCYGSGFPKSKNVALSIDKGEGHPNRGRAIPTASKYQASDKEEKNKLKSNKVETYQAKSSNGKGWEGWGTALKPAHEPIVVARKPLSGTVAATVLEHGTGALNIDGCRVGCAAGDKPSFPVGDYSTDTTVGSIRTETRTADPNPTGRWPANLVFTHAADCADVCADGCLVAELDGQGDGASRFFTVTEWDPIADVAPFRYVAKPSNRERNAGLDGLPEREWKGNYGDGIQDNRPHIRDGYTCQSTTRNTHPTVKPVALMRWLVRLVTPPGGTVLDPFAGSGTTLVAATLEGFDAIGIEMTDDYLPIIEGRVAWAEEQAADTTPTLFDDAGQGAGVGSLGDEL